MKNFAFIDLDSSVIDSKKNASGDGLETAAVNGKGEPSSFINRKQRALLAMLGSHTVVIPTTARETESYARVRLDFSSYAICTFGAVILTPEGVVEPRWHALMAAASAKEESNLRKVEGMIADTQSVLALDLQVQTLVDVGLELYVNTKENKPGHLDQLQAEMTLLLPEGWWIHRNGNNLALCPPYMGKQYAVRWFLDNLAGPYALCVGLGDSFSDLPFMGVCDFALLPTRSHVFTERLKENL